MKPSHIGSMLELAREANKLKKQVIPLFKGPPGIAKSQVCQQWAKSNGLPFIDIRLAYKEAPDMVGFPTVEVVNGVQVTAFHTPEEWPQDPDWEGLILFEEPNRGTTAVMNTMMQILTDRKIGKYTLPKKAIMAACINPEDAHHDVNTMDAALKNRFQIIDVEYDKKDFLRYMKSAEFHPAVINYVESNVFKYRRPEDIGNKKGAQYNSPRTLEALSNSLYSLEKLNKKVVEEIQMEVFEACLGKNEGIAFYSFYHNDQPVSFNDIKSNLTKACKRLSEFSDPKNYKMGHVAITIRDLVENIKDLTEDELYNVLISIPADQTATCLSDIEFKTKDDTWTRKMTQNYPKLKKHMVDNIL